jgi:hypothetical protein
MVKSSKCVLVATRKDGKPILPAELSAVMGINLADYQAFGDGSRWQSAGFTVWEHSHESFSDADEPSEAFFGSQRRALSAFAAILAKVDSAALDAFRRGGVQVEVVIGMTIDDDQMELDLQPEIMAQLGRLNIPFLVPTDSI